MVEHRRPPHRRLHGDHRRARGARARAAAVPGRPGRARPRALELEDWFDEELGAGAAPLRLAPHARRHRRGGPHALLEAEPRARARSCGRAPRSAASSCGSDYRVTRESAGRGARRGGGRDGPARERGRARPATWWATRFTVADLTAASLFTPLLSSAGATVRAHRARRRRCRSCSDELMARPGGAMGRAHVRAPSKPARDGKGRMQSATDTATGGPAARAERRGADDARDGRRDLLRLRSRLLAPQARRGRAAHRAVGRARREGLPRREHPGGVGWRRPRHVGARGGGRGDLGRGQLAAPDRGVAGDRGQHPRPPRHGRPEGPLAARHRRRHHQGGVRHHRAGRRHQLAQPLHVARAPRRPLRAARPEDLHLGRRARRRRAGGGAQPPAGRRARPAVALPRGRGRAGLHARGDPDALHRPRQAVDALLRRRGAGRGPPDRRRGRRARAGVRRAQPGAHHGRGDRRRRRPAGARPRRPRTPTSARSGARRSGPTRACRTRWPRPRSSSSWRG